MNFLAHFYLSAPDEDLITGGFLGDFVKGPLRGQFSPELERGIRLHRHIDSFTDNHLAQRNIRQRLPKPFYRYSGIIADMMCDYFLSKHWHDFHNGSIEAFSQECLALLNSRQNLFTENARQVLGRMDQKSWLVNYGNLNYISETLKYIGLRMRFENPLNECHRFLPAVSQQIEADCLKVLRDTSGAVKKWRASNIPETVL